MVGVQCTYLLTDFDLWNPNINKHNTNFILEATDIAEFEKEQILNLTNSMHLKLATLQLMRPVYLGRPETQSQHSLYIAHFSLARPAWYEFGPCW